MRRLQLAFALPLVLAVLPALAAGDTLTPFRSEAQFARTLDAWHARKVREMERQQRRMATMKSSMPLMPPPAPMALSAPASQELNSIQVTGSRIAADAETIANVQTQGVDEGDIVKRQGDFLIVLRRGRLFTVRVGGDRLEPVLAVDAFGPNVDPSGTWYDEMLVSDGTVVVIGYSYARGGTEVGLFDLDARGGLKYRATYQLRSNDYYSARNYASRLVGRKLVFYTPMRLEPWNDWRARLPAYRRWTHEATPPSFQRMLPAARIYRGLDELGDDVALHTVSICDLDRPRMACESTAVLGGSGEVFYVAEDAVYVWTTGARNARNTPSASIFRMPLDGAAPSMIRAWGSPVDPMAFLQKDGWLNVLVARTANGDGMRNSRHAGEDMALLRVPLSAFGGMAAQASRDRYRLLPGTSGWNLHQRFIGDWLVYGDAAVGGRQSVHALRYASAAPVQTFPLPHSLERIDAMGGDGVLVGNDGGDLVFTGLRLRGTHAALAGAYRRKDAQQGDDRTHGFFYRPTGADDGLLGLPILRGGDRPGASVLFLRNRSLALSPLGTLDSRAGEVEDRCHASCVDWYGNARPIFLGDRIFALMGYELVEGQLDGEAIRERRRVDFAPTARIAQ